MHGSLEVRPTERQSWTPGADDLRRSSAGQLKLEILIQILIEDHDYELAN